MANLVRKNSELGPLVDEFEAIGLLDPDGVLFGFQFTPDGKLKVDAVIATGDISIGAVEIKDGDSDTRLDVEADPVATTKNSAFVQAPSLLAELQAIKAFVDGLEGFTDGIEGALATLNAKDFA